MPRRAVRGIIAPGENVFSIASRERHVEIRIRRYSPWTVHEEFGLNRKVQVVPHPCSSGICTVDLSTVVPLACRDKRGRLVRGIDMVNRFGEFAEPRSNFVRNGIRRFIQSRMSSLFGSDRFIPLDAELFVYCKNRRFLTNRPQRRSTRIHTFSLTLRSSTFRHGRIRLLLRCSSARLKGVNIGGFFHHCTSFGATATFRSYWDDASLHKSTDGASSRRRLSLLYLIQ